MRLRWTVALMVCLGLPMAACADSDPGGSATSEAAPLAGTEWDLDEYAPVGEATTVRVPAAVTATAAFTADQISGDAGCNRFTGTYTTNGTTILFGPVAATLMACPPDVTEVEESYLARLAEATTYAVAGDELTLSARDGSVLLHFSASAPVPLTGTQWRATRINNGKGGVASLVAGTTVTAHFDEPSKPEAKHGMVTGDSGCNRYTGPYTVDGDRLRTGDIATTRRTCEPEVNEQEAQYLEALSATRAFTITRQTLELRDRSGALQVSFTADQPASAAE